MKKHLINARIFPLLTLLGLLAWVPAEAVSLYKWVDESGRVHYSQTPPDSSSTQSEQLQMKDNNPYQSETEKKAAEEKKETKPATSDAGAKIVETRNKNCEIARKNLDTFKNSDRVIQPDGKMLILSDEMRATKIKESQALIDAYCN